MVLICGTSQQTGAAVGLAVLATAAAARTAAAGGSLIAGYQCWSRFNCGLGPAGRRGHP
jgi:hypothetical protein